MQTRQCQASRGVRTHERSLLPWLLPGVRWPQPEGLRIRAAAIASAKPFGRPHPPKPSLHPRQDEDIGPLDSIAGVRYDPVHSSAWPQNRGGQVQSGELCMRKCVWCRLEADT